MKAVVYNKKLKNLSFYKVNARAIIGSALVCLLAGGDAFAQSSTQDKSYESVIAIDERGVNLVSGRVYAPDVSVVIGRGSGGGVLEYHRWTGSFPGFFGWFDNYSAIAETSGSLPQASFYQGNTSKNFGRDPFATGNVVYTSGSPPDGSTLQFDSNQNFVYINSDGGKIYSTEPCKSKTGWVSKDKATSNWQRVTASVYQEPSGKKTTVYYDRIVDSAGCTKVSRPRSIRNNFGYQLHFNYVTEDSSTLSWWVVSSITAFNRSIDYCGDLDQTCGNFSRTWPTLTFTGTQALGSISDPAAQNPTTTFNVDAASILSSSYRFNVNGYALSMTRGGPMKIGYSSTTYSSSANNTPDLSVTVAGQVWRYRRQNMVVQADGKYMDILTVTNPNSDVTTYGVQSYSKDIMFKVDANGRKTEYKYDSANNISNHLLKYIISPEGNIDSAGHPVGGFKEFRYDSRGNLVWTKITPKSGSSANALVEEAGFEAGCANALTCNQPLWRRDSRGAQTDYSYSADHGGLLTELKPAGFNGARALTITSYAKRFASIKNASGALVQESDGVWLPDVITVCQTAPSNPNAPVCDAATTQVRTYYDYGAGGTSEALLVKSKRVVGGTEASKTCYQYDVLGNRIAETSLSDPNGACP